MLCHRRTPWDWSLSLPPSDSLPPAAPPRRAYSAKTPPPLPPKTYKSCRVLLPPRAASCPLHRQHLSLESELLSPKHSVTPLFVPVQCISSDGETRRRRHKSNSLRSHSPGSVCPGASSCTTCAASTSTDHLFQHSRLSPKSVSALCNAALSAASRRRRSKTNCSWSRSETTTVATSAESNPEVRLRRVAEPVMSTSMMTSNIKCTSRRGVNRVPPLPNFPHRGTFSTFVGDSECVGDTTTTNLTTTTSDALALLVDVANTNSSLLCCPTCSLDQPQLVAPVSSMTGSTSSDNLPPHHQQKVRTLRHQRSKTPPANLQGCVCSITSISESLCCTCTNTSATGCTTAVPRAHVPLSKTLRTKLSKWFARAPSSATASVHGMTTSEAALSKSASCKLGSARLSRTKDCRSHCEDCGGITTHTSNVASDVIDKRADSETRAVDSALPGTGSARRSAPRGGATLTSTPRSANATQLASFTANMKMLKKMGWYWGPLSFEEAEQLLANRRDGAFLVRDSAHESYILSLSFRARAVTFHTRIEHVGGKFSFWSQPESHSATTVVEFVEKAMDSSQRGLFHYFLQSSALGQPPVQVSLLHPVSRFSAPLVPSLRHLCRFEILHHVRRDHINELPLPKLLKEYLREKQYYAEYIHQYNEATREEQLQSSKTTAPSHTELATSASVELSNRPLPLQNSHWV